MNVIQFAHEVLDMQDEIARLNREVTRLMKVEADYHQLLGDSIEHGEKMMVGWIDVLLSDRITINA
jgi:hypothetical protein